MNLKYRVIRPFYERHAPCSKLVLGGLCSRTVHYKSFRGRRTAVAPIQFGQSRLGCGCPTEQPGWINGKFRNYFPLGEGLAGQRAGSETRRRVIRNGNEVASECIKSSWEGTIVLITADNTCLVFAVFWRLLSHFTAVALVRNFFSVSSIVPRCSTLFFDYSAFARFCAGSARWKNVRVTRFRGAPTRIPAALSENVEFRKLMSKVLTIGH